MKTTRGWWVLFGMATGSAAMLLALYIGAYIAIVEPQPYPPFTGVPPAPDEEWKLILAGKPVPRYRLPAALCRESAYRRLFWPIHRIDRMIRQETWREGKWTPAPLVIAERC